jgi:hypothetical protein
MPFHILYECTNPECDGTTMVEEWPATRTDPADSTWGDGCDECGAELEEDPIPVDEVEPREEY